MTQGETKDSSGSEDLLLSGHLAAWFKILAVGMITLVAFEAVAVSTAMPFVVEDLGGNRYYALASGISMAAQLVTTVLAGKWVDASGPHRVIYVGIIGFLGGLLVATFAPNIATLVLGRSIQGLGGGLLMVPLYVMVGSYVLPRKRAAFFAAFAIAWVLPSLFGPVAAGLLVDYVHWRWVFGVTPLVFILLAPFGWSKFRQFPSLHASHPLLISNKLLISTVFAGFSIVVLQVISGTDPKLFDWRLLLLAVFVTVASLLFVRNLVPKGTFCAVRGVPATVLFRTLLNGTFLTTEIYLPFILKNVHGWSPTESGMVMMASGITWAAGSWVLGKIENQRILQILAFFGPLGQLVGTVITMVALIPGWSPWWILAGWCLAGFSTGTAYPITSVNALGLTPAENHGEVSSSLQVADTFGASLLIAMGGILHALTSAMGAASFAFTIGLQVALVGVAVWVSTRVFLPGEDITQG